MVNQLVAVYDRNNLALISSQDLASFVGAPAGVSTSDPQIEWDAAANRWLYTEIGFATGNNMLVFGWSKTSDPSDLANGWCHYGVGTGSNLQDYPKLGHDAHFLVVGSNVYDDRSSSFPFVTANVWAIPKPAANDSTCSSSPTATFFAHATHLLKNTDGTLAVTPVPANAADTAANHPTCAGTEAAIFYNRGSSTLLSMIGAQTRTSSTPIGQMDAGELSLGSSSAPNQETAFSTNCTQTPCRWGDYSGATPDPASAHVAWGSNQIDGPTLLGYAQWTTQHFAVSTRPPVPDFNLAVAPASQSVTQGSGTSYPVSIAALNGFSGAVSLSVTGRPAGATRTFSPNPAPGTSSPLTLSSAAITPTDPY